MGDTEVAWECNGVSEFAWCPRGARREYDAQRGCQLDASDVQIIDASDREASSGPPTDLGPPPALADVSADDTPPGDVGPGACTLAGGFCTGGGPFACASTFAEPAQCGVRVGHGPEPLCCIPAACAGDAGRCRPNCLHPLDAGGECPFANCCAD